MNRENNRKLFGSKIVVEYVRSKERGGPISTVCISELYIYMYSICDFRVWSVVGVSFQEKYMSTAEATGYCTFF